MTGTKSSKHALRVKFFVCSVTGLFVICDVRHRIQNSRSTHTIDSFFSCVIVQSAWHYFLALGCTHHHPLFSSGFSSNIQPTTYYYYYYYYYYYN